MKTSSKEEKVEDTFCEAFSGLYTRFIVTAEDEELLRKASIGVIATPATVVGRTEGGIEKYLGEDETPDGRKGFIGQVWIAEKKDATEVLEYELSIRIRQDILCTPTTAAFNALDSPDKFDMMERVGHCGDGYEEVVTRYGREMISIPIMMGYDFLIERYLRYARGIAGGNLWFMCKDWKSGIRIAKKALEAANEVEFVITPFGICAAGSKPETKFPHIGPTTNHPYCPSLKDKILDSRVPEGVGSIPEIVINAPTLEAIRKAMRAAINAVIEEPSLIKISAGNYGGRLGKYKIYLRELI